MGRKKIYTDEELKARQKARREANKEKIAEYDKKRYEENKEKILDKNRQWREANKEYMVERRKQWYENNKNIQNERTKLHYKNNKDWYKNYWHTPIGRASHLNDSYKKQDRKYNRGECTLTSQWIVENIFSKPCHYCGETDWTKIGCDRIDNDKPHTPDNVVPCCFRCNCKKARMSYEEFILKQMESQL